MPIHRLNHAVLYIRSLKRSVKFYREVLGFTSVMEISGTAVFLRAPGSTNDHDLGLFQLGLQAGRTTAGESSVGLYHLAWEVDTLTELDRIRGVLADRGALTGSADHHTTKALYAKDPDGIEFEVCWIVPLHLVTTEQKTAGPRPLPLDLAAEIDRYGDQLSASLATG